MRTIWIATANDTDEVGAWMQIVSYDSADIVRFLLNYPQAHVGQWELPHPAGGANPEMIGP